MKKLFFALTFIVSFVTVAFSQSDFYKNRIGVFFIPNVYSIEYERLFNNTFSVGITTGYMSNINEDFFNSSPNFKGKLLAVNPYFRYCFYHYKDWFTLGTNLKSSTLIIGTNSIFTNTKIANAVEPHLNLIFTYKRFYVVLGIGLKYFFNGVGFNVENQITSFPNARLMPASEIVIGYQFWQE